MSFVHYDITVKQLPYLEIFQALACPDDTLSNARLRSGPIWQFTPNINTKFLATPGLSGKVKWFGCLIFYNRNTFDWRKFCQKERTSLTLLISLILWWGFEIPKLALMRRLQMALPRTTSLQAKLSRPMSDWKSCNVTM